MVWSLYHQTHQSSTQVSSFLQYYYVHLRLHGADHAADAAALHDFVHGAGVHGHARDEAQHPLLRLLAQTRGLQSVHQLGDVPAHHLRNQLRHHASHTLVLFCCFVS